MTLLRPTLQSTASRSIKNAHFDRNTVRFVPEEMPVTISYAGSSHAVLMAMPDDLVDFAIGFSLTEGITQSGSQIRSVDVVEGQLGIDEQVFLADDVSDRLRARRRSVAGPVG